MDTPSQQTRPACDTSQPADNPQPLPAIAPQQVNHIRGSYALVIRALAFLLRLWNRTLRFVPLRDPAPALNVTTPGIYLLWHNRLFIISEINRRFRKKDAPAMHGLVSASKDGAYLSYFFERIGIVPLRGSSSRRGAQALREILEVLDAGGSIGITPDGPRGPCYDFKPGPTLLMRKADSHVVLLGARFSCALRLKSWDGFYIPLPFSKVYLDYELIENPVKYTAEQTPEETAQALTASLRRINPDPRS